MSNKYQKLKNNDKKNNDKNSDLITDVDEIGLNENVEHINKFEKKIKPTKIKEDSKES